MSDSVEPDETPASSSHNVKDTSITANESNMSKSPRENATRRTSKRLRGSNIETKASRPTIITGPFTEREKEYVLTALYEHGCNVDKIAPCVPTRTREQVKDFMTAWFRRVSKIPVITSDQDKANYEPIEAWLKKMKAMAAQNDPEENSLPIQWISRAFGFIAKLEKHPSTAETGGVDFRKLYQFLETMLCGNATPSLDYEDTCFILHSFKELRTRLEKIVFHKDEAYLKRPYASKPRTYKRAKRDHDTGSVKAKEIEELLSTKVLNPIGIPMELLTVKERLKSQVLF